MDKIGKVFGNLTIISKSTKKQQGYLRYYWVQCKCGYVKRLRYDEIRKGKSCGLCDDFIDSNVFMKINKKGMD